MADEVMQRLQDMSDDSLALHNALRTAHDRPLRSQISHVTTSRHLSDRALSLLLHLAPQPALTTGEGLHALSHFAQVAQTTQEAAMQLTTGLAREVEHRRVATAAGGSPVVVVGPSPQQHLLAAVDLLKRVPNLCAAARNRLAAAEGKRSAGAAPIVPLPVASLNPPAPQTGGPCP
ncbi:hypothetical protein [Streptomyces decoyicus]|uniref:hypothetical protein n=1 Tax=Streptomyces decoyicus TaxID=249567 RepID=UPI00386673D7